MQRGFKLLLSIGGNVWVSLPAAYLGNHTWRFGSGPQKPGASVNTNEGANDNHGDKEVSQSFREVGSEKRNEEREAGRQRCGCEGQVLADLRVAFFDSIQLVICDLVDFNTGDFVGNDLRAIFGLSIHMFLPLAIAERKFHTLLVQRDCASLPRQIDSDGWRLGMSNPFLGCEPICKKALNAFTRESVNFCPGYE